MAPGRGSSDCFSHDNGQIFEVDLAHIKFSSVTLTDEQVLYNPFSWVQHSFFFSLYCSSYPSSWSALLVRLVDGREGLTNQLLTGSRALTEGLLRRHSHLPPELHQHQSQTLVIKRHRERVRGGGVEFD